MVWYWEAIVAVCIDVLLFVGFEVATLSKERPKSVHIESRYVRSNERQKS